MCSSDLGGKREYLRGPLGNYRTLLFGLALEGYETGGIFAIDADGSNTRIIMPTVVEQVTPDLNVRISSILDTLPDNDDEILIQGNLVFKHGDNPSVYRVDLKTAKRKTIVDNPGNVISWLTDWQGNVRLGIRVDRKQITLLHRWPDQRPWGELSTLNLARLDYVPLEFSPDGRSLYSLEDIDGLGAALVKVDLTNKARSEILFDPPEGEVLDTILDFQTHEVVGALYQDERLRARAHYFNPEWARRQSQVDAALPNRDNRWIGGSRDGKRILLKSYSDRVDGEYYLYSPEDRKLTQLFSARPWLKPEDLGAMQPISYAAADGLRIPALLTLPPTGPTNHLPLVVLPHGGPWSRDVWTWDPDVQFLASRGYAVLQPNFRGSDGFGRKFLEAGYREWGGKMIDDLATGARWAIDQGYADPKRVAIFGASFGGYAAIMGLIRNPELYRCGIGYLPVTDLRSWLDSKHWSPLQRRLMELSVGQRGDNYAQLKEASPLLQVDKIQAPLLFAWGGEDDRIAAEDGHKFVAALKRLGKPHRSIFKKDEGHGFIDQANIVELYTAVEDFLRQNLSAEQK